MGVSSSTICGKVEDDYRAKSRLLNLDEWLGRPRGEKVFDNLMRLTSSLM